MTELSPTANSHPAAGLSWRCNSPTAEGAREAAAAAAAVSTAALDRRRIPGLCMGGDHEL